MQPDTKLTHAQALRAEAMRLAIHATNPFGEEASFAHLIGVAEAIEEWLWEAKEPAIKRPGAAELRAVGNGHG